MLEVVADRSPGVFRARVLLSTARDADFCGYFASTQSVERKDFLRRCT